MDLEGERQVGIVLGRRHHEGEGVGTVLGDVGRDATQEDGILQHGDRRVGGQRGIHLRGVADTDIGEREVHADGGAFVEHGVFSDLHRGGDDVRAVGRDHLDILEIGDVVLGKGHELAVAGIQPLREGERDVAVGIREGGGDQQRVTGERDVSVRGDRGGIAGTAGGDHRADGNRHLGGQTHIDPHRRITEAVVDLPIVLFPAGRGGLHGHVAARHDAGDGGNPDAVVFAVRVEHLVVHAEGIGVIARVGGDAAAHADSPVEVLVPVAVVGGADVAHGALLLGAEQGLAETFGGLEVARLAAVADHQAVLVGILQLGHMRRGERRIRPAGLAAVGGVVRPTHTVADLRADLRRLRGTVVKVRHDIGVAGIVAVHVVVGDVVDLAVGVRGSPARIGAGNQHCVAQVGGVGHGVLLIHHDLLDLVGELGVVGGGHTAVVAVGEKVGARECGVVEVGNMGVVGLAGESGKLLAVAEEEHERGRRVGGRGVVVLGLDEALDGGGGAAHAGLVREGDLHDVTQPSLPGDEGGEVLVVGEHRVTDDQILDGGGGVLVARLLHLVDDHVLVQREHRGGELLQLDGLRHVRIHKRELDVEARVDSDFLLVRVILHRADIEVGKCRVALDAGLFHMHQGEIDERVGVIDEGIVGERRVFFGLGDRFLRGEQRMVNAEFRGVVVNILRVGDGRDHRVADGDLQHLGQLRQLRHSRSVCVAITGQRNQREVAFRHGNVTHGKFARFERNGHFLVGILVDSNVLRDGKLANGHSDQP